MNDSPAFRALSDVVLAMASEREVEPVLQRLVHAARELGDARYAALGVPDGEGAFSRFITSGMSEKLIEAMGPLPRTHGLLGAMLESPELSIVEERNRLARVLHDNVTQRLFGVALAVESAETLLERDAGAAGE